MYNIIAVELEGYSCILFSTTDLIEAENKLVFIREALTVPSLLIKSPEYKEIRLEKSEVISRFDIEPHG